MEPDANSDTITDTTTFLVVGGGIAGVSCCETLRFLCPNAQVTLVTESALIKTVTNLVPLAKSLARFDVAERSAEDHQGSYSEPVASLVQYSKSYSPTATVDPLLRIISGDRVRTLESASQLARTAAGRRIRYELLCLCTGARPQLIAQAAEHGDRVLGIRDTESVAQFQRRVRGARRLAIVGNGGIAAECAYAVRGAHVDWVIRDRFVAQTFVDPGAAEFFRARIEQPDGPDAAAVRPAQKAPVKRMRYGETEEAADGTVPKAGAALGPDWHRRWDLTSDQSAGGVTVHTECEVLAIETDPADAADGPLHLQLSNGTRIVSDVVVSATGVRPAITVHCTDAELRLSAVDGGILVDRLQRTSVPRVYAAGDVCTADWRPLAEHWLQMRLWTQARQMGAMAARAMAARWSGELTERSTAAEEALLQDFCFELFGHVTQLFGFQVVLLGKFNGQGLGGAYEALIRTTPGVEYIKYVLKGGRVHGAILIGETGLEETTENLILNGLDVSGYGEGLLDPDVDIEDYFD